MASMPLLRAMASSIAGTPRHALRVGGAEVLDALVAFARAPFVAEKRLGFLGVGGHLDEEDGHGVRVGKQKHAEAFALFRPQELQPLGGAFGVRPFLPGGALREVGEYTPTINLGHGVKVKFKINIVDEGAAEA